MICVDAVYGAIIGLAVAAVLAIINSWLSDREKGAENIRDQRIRTYPAVWERTSVVSRWPRTDATRDHLVSLHLDLRTWYYSGGGLYLSEDSEERYEHLQVVLQAIIAQDADQPLVYDEPMEAAHWLRAGLAQDLRTRSRHDPIGSWRRRRRRRAEGVLAKKREDQVGALVYAGNGRLERRPPEHRTVVRLTDRDERLSPVAPSDPGADPTPE